MAVDAMMKSLSHRGPDDEGTWFDREAGLYLGFRRLSILDLSAAGHQPMESGSGRFVIAFNGEVYNSPSLRRELSGVGHRFKGTSDTEVLLAAFEEWSVPSALRKFRGMFALALWDTHDRRLWLARDRIGIKPLYLLNAGDAGIAFASEARAFHHCPMFSGRGDRGSGLHFLGRLYVPGPASILEGVERIPPGEVREFTLGSGRVREVSRLKYWDLIQIATSSSTRPSIRAEEAVDELHDLLRESVRMRLASDRPVGAFLSGGIDSAVVVAIMQELSPEPVRTFTIRFDHPDFDEGPVASAVAAHLGTRHTAIAFPSTDLLDLIPTLPSLCDEPMANPSFLPTLLVSRVARRDVVVALSGDGGDELFGGYNRYQHGAALIRRIRRVPPSVRRVLGSTLSAVAQSRLRELTFGMLKSSSMGRQQSAAEQLMKAARVLRATTELDAYSSLLTVGNADLGSNGGQASRLDSDAAFDAPCGPLESRMMLLDQLQYLPDDLLAKLDRASMRESLEARVPILDHKIIEFSWRLSLQTKIRKGSTKWPLRQIARRYLPLEVLDRPKMGFTVPIAQWLGGELREWARDTLSVERSRALPFLDPKKTEAAWRQFEGGRSDLALPLWTAAVLQAWSDAWNVSFD